MMDVSIVAHCQIVSAESCFKQPEAYEPGQLSSSICLLLFSETVIGEVFEDYVVGVV
jgi:hypothetical protein